MEEEPCRRNHEEEIIEGESCRRVIEGESWRGNLGSVIMDAARKHLKTARTLRVTPRDIHMALRVTQKAHRRHSGDTQAISDTRSPKTNKHRVKPNINIAKL